MSRRRKERSYLKYFLVISLAVHLGILFLIPFDLTSIAMRGIIEAEGKFYDVDFIQIESEKVTPVGQKETGDKEIVKPEPEKQNEKKPVEEPLVAEPKPEEKTQGIKGSEEKPLEAEPNLEQVVSESQDELKEEAEPKKEIDEQPDPLTQPKPEIDEVAKGDSPAEPVKDVNKSETDSKSDETQISKNESTVQSNEIITNEHSDEIIEIEEKPPADSSEEVKADPKIDPQKAPPQKEEVASTPQETGQPEEAAEPEKSKEPALPTEAGQMIAQSLQPVYPKAAANQGQEGTVNLLVTVDTTGEVSEVVIVQSSSNSILDMNAKNTVKLGWKFRPFSTSYTIHMAIEYKAGGTKVILGEIKFLE